MTSTAVLITVRAMQIPSSLADIRRALLTLPTPSSSSIDQTAAREAVLTKPPGALGRLEQITAWLAAWQGESPPRADVLHIAVFAGNHGIAAKGVSAYPADVTAQMVDNFQAGGAAVNQLSKLVGARLSVVPLSLDEPTADISEQPAMDESDFMSAFQAGWSAVERGTHVLAIGEMGIANTTAAAALCLAMFGGTANDWTGPGTGVGGDALDQKIAAVAMAVKRHRDAEDALDLLRRLGGRELAAMAGAVLAARHQKIPVLIDGFVAGASVAPLWGMNRDALLHCQMAHVSAEPGHQRLLRALNMKPLLDLNMRLGEASGAALALNLVKAAVACHTGMASFADAGVSDKD